jgi:hypothetical protein
MGREAQATVSFRGERASAKVLLEGAELVLRGGIKARFARDALVQVAASSDGLSLIAGGEALHIALPEAEAARWAKAILTPPPSLASKLGIGADKPALVLGNVADSALAEALKGATAVDVSSACAIVAPIENQADLDAALAKANATRLPLWCVYPKGKAANPGDSAIRTALRGAGMMDNKTSAVSARLTATRYGWPKS